MKKMIIYLLPSIGYWVFCWAVTVAVVAEFINPASFIINWVEYNPVNRGVFMLLHSLGLFYTYMYSWHKGFFEYD